MSHVFESVLEKTARILARQYGVNVVFEGNIPCTDGKTIFLPQYEDMSEELRFDMNGFIDHEVAHCKFTDFPQISKCINKLHNMLTQNIEDYRIEKLMIEEYPGCEFNLGPLNVKYRGLIDVDWMSRPWPMRLITTIRDVVEGRKHRVDPDFKRYFDLVTKAEFDALRKVSSTGEVRELTEAIIKKIYDEREKEKKEEKERGEGGGEGKDELESMDKGDSKKGKGKGEKSKGGSPGGEPSADDMLDAEVGDKVAEAMDKFVTSVEGLIEKEFTKKASEEEKSHGRHTYRIRGGVKKGTKVIPLTTRYDKVTDHSGKGDAARYGALRKASQALIAPIKSQLERVLKVKENAKWQTEREAGTINSRSLAQLASNKAYRPIFKDFVKTETNNVAVELLIDLSGSMHGTRIETARAAAVGLAEAMKDLDIPFEVTGFCSEYDDNVSRAGASVDAKDRFTRRNERLDLHVFKSFDCTSLIGISKMRNGSQNPDGECVAWAAKRLSMQKQKRKILMVLSDGQPATGDTPFEVLQEDLRTRIGEISKHGIEVIGVGIETDYVKHFYPDFVILKEVKELPRQVMAKIAKLLEG